MEVIASVSALLSLVSAASTTATSIISVCQQIQDAPAEVALFTTKLCLFKAELEQLQSSSPEGFHLSASSQSSDALYTAFSSATAGLKSVQQACSRLQRPNNHKLSSRLRWVYIEKPAAERLLKGIRDTESSITVIFGILTMYTL